MNRAGDCSFQELMTKLFDFVGATSGLDLEVQSDDSVQLVQRSDQKVIPINTTEISDVLTRSDGDGKAFIQVNFKSGKKILITDELVGFKPAQRFGLDMKRLPNVVTTPDIMSVFEAIEESLSAVDVTDEEIDVLKRVYESIVEGGEEVGFDLSKEKIWLARLIATNQVASA